jgi:hypothetical protein
VTAGVDRLCKSIRWPLHDDPALVGLRLCTHRSSSLHARAQSRGACRRCDKSQFCRMSMDGTDPFCAIIPAKSP